MPSFSDNSPINLTRSRLVQRGYQRDLVELANTCDGKDLVGIFVPEMIHRKNVDLSQLTIEDKCSIIANRCQITSPLQLESKLRKAQEAGRMLNVKFGIDATGRDLHLGHAVPMVMAGRLQRMGHKLQIIVGDFTARIGDPSGRANARKPLSEQEIRENVTKYTNQFSHFFDVSTAQISYNSDWLDKMTLADGFRLFSQMSLSSAIQREDFRERIKAGQPISQAEILYANLMGIDSVQLKTDIELGGIDQTLNFHVCRSVMELHGLEPEVLLTSPIIPGTSGNGQKMSKSLNNYISLLESEHDIFGKVMSVPDSLIGVYFNLLTEIQDVEWKVLADRMAKGTLNPRDVKAAVAASITALIRGEREAIDAAQAFADKFSARSYSLGKATCSVVVSDKNQAVASAIRAANVVSSSSEVRRLIEGGAVSVFSKDGEAISKVSSVQQTFDAFSFPLLLKVGKLHIIKVELKELTPEEHLHS